MASNWREMALVLKEQIVCLNSEGRKKNACKVNCIWLIGNIKVSKRIYKEKIFESNAQSGQPKLTSVPLDWLLNRFVLKDQRYNFSDLTPKFNNSIIKPLSKWSVERRLDSLSLFMMKSSIAS